jgi:hypothetical protein
MKLTKYLKITVSGTKKACKEQFKLLSEFADMEVQEICACKEPLPIYQNEVECAICSEMIRR